MLLVVFSSGPDHAKDEQLLPALARALSAFRAEVLV